MKIIRITKSGDVYTVTQAPNWLERLFGKKETTSKYKKDGYKEYMFGGEIYYNQEGEKLEYNHKIGIALDKFNHSF